MLVGLFLRRGLMGSCIKALRFRIGLLVLFNLHHDGVNLL